MRNKRKSDTKDGLAGRGRILSTHTAGSSFARKGRSDAKHERNRNGRGIWVRDCPLHRNGGQLTANNAATRLHARCRMMHAASMGIGAARRFASSIRHEQRGYQDNSHSRAVKYAVRHGISLPPAQRNPPVTWITRTRIHRMQSPLRPIRLSKSTFRSHGPVGWAATLSTSPATRRTPED